MTLPNTGDAEEGVPETDFSALVAELGTLAKAIPDDAAAPGELDEDALAAVDAEAAAAAAAGGAAEGETVLGKSFAVTLEGGETVEAFDATEMLKSLQGDVGALRDSDGRASEAIGAIGKFMVRLNARVGQLGDLVKAQRAEIERLGNAPAGRRSVLTGTAPAPAAAAKPASIGEVFAKAQSLQAAGKLSGMDVARVVAHSNRGQPVPEDLAPLFAG